MSLDETITLFQGLLTPMLAILTGYIAYQQYKINHRREKRESRQAKLSIYRKIKNFLNYFKREETIPADKYNEVKDAIAEADFLFTKDVLGWLEDFERAFDDTYDWQQEFRREKGEDIKIRGLCYSDSDCQYKEQIKESLERLHSFRHEVKDIFAGSMES